MTITLAQEKAFNALVYFAERIQPLYLTKAIKLLYLADEYAIKKSGVPITWLDYKVWRFGPVPEEVYNRVKRVANQKQAGLEADSLPYLDVTAPPSTLPDGVMLVPIKTFDDSEFSDYDISILQQVVERYGHYSGEQLVDALHKKGTLWHRIVSANNLEEQFQLKGNRSDYVIEFTDLLDTDYKKAAFEVAYQSYLMESNLM